MYKGSIPARFGGRLSSVLDISMKEGNLKRAQGTFSVSPIAGRLTLEGPIKKDTASYILSARRTFVDGPIRLGQLVSGQTLRAAYYFYDYSGKMNWKLNAKNHLYFSSYFGKDRYYMNDKEEGIKSKYGYSWGNITSVLRWNSELSPKLFMNATAYFSHFYNKQKIKINDEGQQLFDIGSGLNDFAIASDFDWYPNLNHSIKFGIKSSFQKFSPQVIKIQQEGTDTIMGKGIEYRALINSVYFEDDLPVTRTFGINAGFRLDWYQTGSKDYFCFQPRISGKYLVAPQLSVKASCIKMGQFLHLLSNSSIGLPTDLWVSSTEKVKLQKGWQVSTGIFYKSGKGDEFSGEGYYKEMNRVIRLDEGESFFDSREKNWENKLIAGNGNAYGIEFLYKKNYGRLTGLAGYALSWSNREFPGINHGKPFPYRYDKRHDISILGEYLLFDNGIDSKSFTFGFTFNTGYAVSIPDMKHHGLNILTDKGESGYLGLFEYLQSRVTYAAPNNYRMPSFHHFDIAYRINRKLSENRSRTWSFSAYNVYNRLNPWYFYKKNDKMKQVSLFPLIPSVSFTYKW